MGTGSFELKGGSAGQVRTGGRKLRDRGLSLHNRDRCLQGGVAEHRLAPGPRVLLALFASRRRRSDSRATDPDGEPGRRGPKESRPGGTSASERPGASRPRPRLRRKPVCKGRRLRARGRPVRAPRPDIVPRRPRIPTNSRSGAPGAARSPQHTAYPRGLDCFQGSRTISARSRSVAWEAMTTSTPFPLRTTSA
jgi:hypothetical protein